MFQVQIFKQTSGGITHAYGWLSKLDHTHKLNFKPAQRILQYDSFKPPLMAENTLICHIKHH